MKAFFVLFAFVISFAASQTPANQIQALIDLNTATNGANWLRQWSLSTDPCLTPQWYGVTCDVASNIISVNLAANRLVGELPASFSNLVNLQVL